MTNRRFVKRILASCLILALFMPASSYGQEAQDAAQENQTAPVFKAEELDQMVAPIALYPDDLLSQIFMASTYPLEIVQAARWAEVNKDLQDDALAVALEKEPWDPSVKSLVAFPQVLSMMNEKLDWTQNLGDAFLCQQKDVMDTVQRLRDKADAEGNLKSTKEQTVIIEEETIIIESTDPEVVYVPVYNPTVVYGTWWYPSYPPYYYYPPGYVYATPYVSFVAGVAVGAAWGYAWVHCDWHGGDVNIDVDRNTNINNNIDRDAARQKLQDKGASGKGEWKHNAEHRKGVSYRDPKTAQQYDRMASSEKIKSREEFRGRTESGSRDLSKASSTRDSSSGSNKKDSNRGSSPRDTSAGKSERDFSREPIKMDQNRNNVDTDLFRDSVNGDSDRGSTGRDASRGSGSHTSQRESSGSRSSAFDSMSNGSSARSYSSQGKSSRSSMNRSAGSGSSRSYSGGSRGGGSSGGGGGRGGGGRR